MDQIGVPHLPDESTSLKFLRDTATHSAEYKRKVFALLGFNAETDPACKIMINKYKPPITNSLGNLLNLAMKKIREDRVSENVFNWPFRNFWENPVEPKHSSLIRYFIDPKQAHGQGIAFLRNLFNTLKLENLKVDAQCIVKSEVEHIDILITRDVDGDDKNKYAILIENKINGAPDQDKQLQRYVNSLKDHGFSMDQILPIYLPLTYRKPNSVSRGTIPENKIRIATFEKEIVAWLRKSIEECTSVAMTDNLKQYLNLIIYLLQLERTVKMRMELLERLREEKNPPTWNEVKELSESANELALTWKYFARSKLLEYLKNIIDEMMKGCQVYFWNYLGGEEEAKKAENAFECPIAQEKGVSIDIGGIITLAIGIDDPVNTSRNIWHGYHISDQKRDDCLNFLKEHKKILKFNDDSQYWYNCEYETDSESILLEQTDMGRKCLFEKLKKEYEEMKELIKQYKTAKQL
jgi:hypothetical protein